ncbi:MAG: chemotaxis protein CheW [Candidatus Wallbacteria bacterium]|nr:chemotaxis protein CheW [Candidatus Wallbacteria bacterium]
MNPSEGGWTGRAAELRRSFDDSFARPASATGERQEDFLALGVARQSYAVRLSEVRGLVRVRLEGGLPVPGAEPRVPASDRHFSRNGHSQLGESSGTAAELRSVVRLPSTRRELLGICGLRGALVPVFDLSALLGLEADMPSASWCLLAGGNYLVGFAFERLDGYVRARDGSVVPAPAATHCVTQLLRHDGGARPLIALRALVGSIERAAAGRPEETGEASR